MEGSNVSLSRKSFVGRFLERRSQATARARAEIPIDRPYFCGSFPFILLLILGVIGTFAAGFLTYRHILLVSETGAVGESFLCRAGARINCDAVLLTDYAMLMDYISSAVLGLMGFVFVLWCTANALVNERLRKISWIVLLLYFFAAIGFSWYFLYLMAFVVANICPWCIVVHVVNIISLVILIVVSIRKRRQFLLPEISTVGERSYFLAGGILLSLLVFFASGMWEKQLSFEDAKAKYEGLANDPVVIMAMLKSSPSYDIPISRSDPSYGLPSAPYPLVLFGDFECPVCARMEIFLVALVKRNRKYLRLVYKSYPLSTSCNDFILGNLHPMACTAARAAYAAFLLGGNRAFLKYGNLLFQNQHRLSKAPWLKFAKKLKLDPKKFQEMMKEDSPAAKKVRKDLDLGISLKLSSTPQIFFLNKRLPENLRGAYFTGALEALIRMNHPEEKNLRLKLP
ncbi:MAG: vitamin K epoxide reductase family protein [Deltaproteobacteria bacterium]